MFIFSFSWICIILRLICEILSGIAVEIRFLWNSKHGVYGAVSFIAIVTSCYLCKDMRKFTSAILYMDIICIPQWLCDANFEILHFSGVYARRHKHCKPECSFRQTCVDYFLPRKYDVISQLRHSYAKDAAHIVLVKSSITNTIVDMMKTTDKSVSFSRIWNLAW